MKRISVFLFAILLCFTFTGLNGNSSFTKASAASDVNTSGTQESDTTLEGAASTDQELIPSTENVKLLGRTYLLDDTLWLALSGTGIEFTFTGTKVEIPLIGDNVATASWGEGNFCRVGIYVNDKLVSDTLLKEAQKTITAFESNTEQTVTVRVVKLSEAGNSTVGIGRIKVNATGTMKPTEAKTHRIEFIGDSITCGFGVEDADRNNGFSTATENVAKTFAYKTAQALNADYSMVAFSGYGIISGYSTNGKPNVNQLISTYYNKMGSSSGYFNSTVKADSIDWDFNNFKPDIIVINLGTNDNSYTGTNAKKQKQFTKGYVTFLKQVRKQNPKAKILCTLGMMGDTLYPSINSAVKQYTKATGDKKVYSMKFDLPVYSDGFGACWHPSETTHTKAAKKLTAQIKKLMKW